MTQSLFDTLLTCLEVVMVDPPFIDGKIGRRRLGPAAAVEISHLTWT
jgi:hypothetical protein